MADRRNTIAALVVLALLAAGCERATEASPTGQSSSGPPASTATAEVVPEGFERTTARLGRAEDDADALELDVWFAGEPDQWRQGLTGVTDLDGADGMLFAFDAAAEYRFYMWQTPVPLDIYFFDTDGRFIASEAMSPCMDASSTRCERFSPGAPFLLALEVPQGSLDTVTIDETWTISFEPPDPASSGADASAPPTPPSDR